MEDAGQQNLQTVEPAVAAPAQAAVEEQHLEHVQRQQDDTRRIDQQIERQWLRHEQVEQHHTPERHRQSLAQAQDELHTPPPMIYCYAGTVRSSGPRRQQ